MATSRGIERLLATVARLRGEGGCPWDREQTIASLRPYLIEECYELVDAIDADDREQHAEELGDLLLQIVLQAQIRAEAGAFTFDDVADRLTDKLVRRHPHVFGETEVADSAEVLRNWEKLKSRERDRQAGATLQGIPRHLPALQKAQRIQSRAARVGFDWPHAADVMEKVEEELAETRQAIAGADAEPIKEELGDLLFAVVNLCRFHGIQAEEALEATNAKFVRRFREVERRLQRDGRDIKGCSLEEMDRHWNAIKREENAGAAAPTETGDPAV